MEDCDISGNISDGSVALFEVDEWSGVCGGVLLGACVM